MLCCSRTGTARLTNAQTVRSRKGSGYLERQFQGTKVPWNERSRERMFQGTNSLENESSRERTVQGTNVPRNEWSRERKFHHGNECSRERIVLGTNNPDTLCQVSPPLHKTTLTTAEKFRRNKLIKIITDNGDKHEKYERTSGSL